MRQIIIRTKQQYWKDYILEGLSKNLPTERIRQNLLDAFRKEIFDQIMMHCDATNPQGISDDTAVINICKQAENKWRSLCKMCSQYIETRSMIKPNDIREVVLERAKNMHDNEEP